MLNTVGRLAMSTGNLRRWLAPASIIEKAQRITGMEDWGEDAQAVESLGYLSRINPDTCGLTAIGALMLRSEMVKIVKNRMEIIHRLSQEPAIAQKPVVKPLVIIGLPRTGTTLLQNLLAQDSRCRFLRGWECDSPLPIPSPESENADPRIAHKQREMDRLYSYSPRLKTIHYSSPLRPIGCMAILKNGLIEPARFTLFGGLEDYEHWCMDQSPMQAYGFYKLQLQMLQWNYDFDHWVLKGPSHMYFLDGLLNALPDAHIIHTHRRLQEVVPSAISLVDVYRHLVSSTKAPGRVSLGEEVTGNLKAMLNRAYAVREQSPAASIHDVHYKVLMKDPIHVVKNLYDACGLHYSDDFGKKMQGYLDRNPKAKFGVHRYSMEEYGITESQLRSAFGEYVQYSEHH